MVPNNTGKKLHRVNQDAYVRVVKALLKEPQTLTNLEELTGLHRVTLYRLFRLFKKHGVVHVSAWEPDSRGRDAFAVYTLGGGRDKAKYCMTVAERRQRYRDRVKMKAETVAIDKLIQGKADEIRSL